MSIEISKVEVLWACYKKDDGFIAESQPTTSLYFEMTEDITKARLYKIKKKAARALNYKNENHSDLKFFEVKLQTTLTY